MKRLNVRRREIHIITRATGVCAHTLYFGLVGIAINRAFTGPIGHVYGLPGEALDLSQPIILICFDPFWVCGVHGSIPRSIVSNSYF